MLMKKLKVGDSVKAGSLEYNVGDLAYNASCTPTCVCADFYDFPTHA